MSDTSAADVVQEPPRKRARTEEEVTGESSTATTAVLPEDDRLMRHLEAQNREIQRLRLQVQTVTSHFESTLDEMRSEVEKMRAFWQKKTRGLQAEIEWLREERDSLSAQVKQATQQKHSQHVDDVSLGDSEDADELDKLNDA